MAQGIKVLGAKPGHLGLNSQDEKREPTLSRAPLTSTQVLIHKHGINITTGPASTLLQQVTVQSPLWQTLLHAGSRHSILFP